jgi:transcriptional regulator with XRE-family HTH domain
MSSKRKKTAVQKALTQLRKSLGMTQQELSERLGVILNSVSRWESSRPPSGHSLWQLQRFARDVGAPEIAAIFQRAIDQENPKHTFTLPMPPDTEALAELRAAAHHFEAAQSESSEEDGGLWAAREALSRRVRTAYVAALRGLQYQHAVLLSLPFDEDEWYAGTLRIWENTQKDLEWLLKHEEKDLKEGDK